jgi:hypothetical protein
LAPRKEKMCPADSGNGQLPTCATGPAGRLAFVDPELRHALRSWRRAQLRGEDPQ